MDCRRTITISLIIYVLTICHVVCSEGFFTDSSKIFICNTEEYFDSIRNVSEDYRCNLCRTNENLLALPKNSFNQLPNMESIDLSGLLIQELSVNAFSGLSKVREINLQKNNISKISRNVLDQLPTLELLDLSYNRINTLTDEVFAGSKSMEYLDLSYNKLANIAKDVLYSLRKLEVLNISNNALNSGDLQSFCRLPHLKLLFLDKNYINNLDSCLRDTKITSLYISDNFLGNIEYSMFPPKLNDLFLSGNYITVILNKTFYNLVELKILDLSRNQIRYIFIDSFKNLMNLEVLNIAQNQITNFQGNIFSNLMNLKLLNISYNALSNIEDNTFTSLASLRILDLRRNLLEDSLHINDEVANSLPDLRILHTDKSEDTASLYDNEGKSKKNNIELGSNVKLNRISYVYESLNDENFTSNKDERFIRIKRDDSSNDSLNNLKDTMQNLQKVLEKLTGTIESLTEKLSGQSQNIEKFSASINNISTHFIPDAKNINFGGDELDMHVNENTNTAPKKDQVVTPDLTKLEGYFHKFFDNFSSFLNRTEERDLKILTEKHEKTDNKNQSLMDTFSRELFDEFAIEAKEMVAILSQLRLLVIFFGLVLLLLLTLKTFNKIKRLSNRGKHEYHGLSMEMPIINESQNSRF